MKYKLALCGLFCVVFIAGCSSPPTLPESSGSWEDFNPPVKTPVQLKGGMVNEKTK